MRGFLLIPTEKETKKRVRFVDKTRVTRAVTALVTGYRTNVTATSDATASAREMFVTPARKTFEDPVTGYSVTVTGNPNAAASPAWSAGRR